MTKTKRREDIAALAVDAAVDALSPLVTAVSLYDRDSGELRRTAAASGMVETSDRTGELSDDEMAWDAFVRGEVQFVENAGDGSPVGPKTAIPLGDHGVFVAEFATQNDFNEDDAAFARTLATSTEAAMEAADRERTILDRTERLRERNDDLDRLRRVDAIVRDIVGTLVRATSRGAIEREVCERLAAVNDWDFSWVGERRVTRVGIGARTHTGSETYLDAVDAASDEAAFTGTPAEQALSSGDPVVKDDIVATPAPEGWRTVTLDHGFRSVAAIPLRHEHREYGVLEVYSTDPRAFGEEETALLVELGDMVAYAVNAVERERAMVAGAGPELELRVENTTGTFPELAAAADTSVAVDGLVPGSDGSFLAYATLSDAAPEDVETYVERSTNVEQLRPLAVEDGRFEFRLSTVDLFETVAAGGGTISGLTADAAGTTVRVRLPATGNVRDFVEAFTSAHEDVEVLAQRSTPEGAGDVRSGFVDRLTDRQREVMRVAYHAGFFDWPRESTGEDIADTLGVSPPTVHKHIRAVERKLIGAVLEADPSGGM
jgi:GAF domain-containing protein/DNA-binding CsgD family transcriptional regulator